MQWDGEPLREIETDTLRSKVGENVSAANIVEDAVDVLDRVGKRACLLELDVSPLLRLYENRRRAELVFRIKHGAVANFGETIVSGTQKVDKDVVLHNVSWKQGECYRESKVNDTRTNLINNQLFSSVTIKHPNVPDAQGQVPMTVEVKERAVRTLRAGTSYSSDQGVVLNGGWEHRNFFGGGQRFNADVSVGQEEQSLQTGLRLPNFLDDDQTLALRAGVKHEDTDAYTADTIDTGVTLERKLARNWRGGLGVGFTLTETDDALSGNSQYGLLSFPGFVEYDSRRNVLDPKRGIFANVTVTPYTETFGDGGQFLKTQGTFQTYLSAPKQVSIPLSPTLALKVAGGTITGGDGQDVPADIRFYAGGGGSVRGYGYQTLGPRVNNVVVGGSSFVAGSAEARLRFTEELGGVVFMDAGNAFADTAPDEQAKLYTSVGVGARYFTSIGPIRADLAIPMNGKDIGAAGYALYISIGQSF
jgi:translocation and assembly module TamA